MPEVPMRLFFVPVVLSLFLGLGIAAIAQDDPSQDRPRQQQQQPSDEGNKVSFTGCLTKDSQPEQYVVTDQSSGEKISFRGSDKLENYVNQTVRVSGKVVDRGGEKAFQPETLDVVSTSCGTPEKQ
jgi:hypothetical protein